MNRKTYRLAQQYQELINDSLNCRHEFIGCSCANTARVAENTLIKLVGDKFARWKLLRNQGVDKLAQRLPLHAISKHPYNVFFGRL